MKSSAYLGILLIVGAACARLLPHPPNVTPVIAMALVGGIYLDRKIAIIVPLAALFLSDLILGFHGVMAYVYGSVLLISLLGIAIQRRKNAVTIVGGSLVGSLLFFLMTNAGVWLQGGGRVYPMTMEGLMLSYTLALPFFRNAVFGDLLFVAVLAGPFELSRRFGPGAVPQGVMRGDDLQKRGQRT